MSQQDIYKVSNLHCHLKKTCGEESVKLFQNWENIVKKMRDFWNHRMFTLRCIKVGISPVSCKLMNPMKTPQSYHIIHKAKKHWLYERVRNINNYVYMYELKRTEWYDKLRNLIQDWDISWYNLFINKVKEFRYHKTKTRQKDKLNRLINKRNRYLYNHHFGTFGGHIFLVDTTTTKTSIMLISGPLHLQQLPQPYQFQHP